MNLRYSIVGILILMFSTLTSKMYFPILLLLLICQIYMVRGLIPKKALKVITPLCIMLLTGLFFSETSILRDLLKDVWYVGKAIVVTLIGTLLGYSFFPQNYKKWLNYTFNFGVLAVIIDFVSFMSERSLYQAAVLLPSLGVVLLLPFFLREQKNSMARWVVAVPVFAAVILSGSRTTIVVLVVAGFGAWGAYQSRRKLILAATVIAVSGAAIFPLLPRYDVYNITFLGKIQHSLNEISFVTDDDLTNITASWRGFEAFKAFEMWRNAEFVNQVFGSGLGTEIDIGIYYDLNGSGDMRYLPILHDAYFMVLVKFGVLGVLLFLGYMLWPFWLPYQKKKGNPQYAFARRLGATTSLTLIITSITISGPLNIGVVDSVTLLFGWSIGAQLKFLCLGKELTLSAEDAEIHSTPY